ncbi:hypothetical protein BV20DRAFT_931873, partial [Pilatotrama ljubarskyi]
MAAAAAIPIARTSSPASFDGEDRARQSYASTSPASYLTAPLPSPSPHSPMPSSSSRPSSTHTLAPAPASRDPDTVNPIHSLAFAGGKQSPAQEVHILKVSDDVVELGQGPVPEPVLHKVGASIAHAVPN